MEDVKKRMQLSLKDLDTALSPADPNKPSPWVTQLADHIQPRAGSKYERSVNVSHRPSVESVGPPLFDVTGLPDMVGDTMNMSSYHDRLLFNQSNLEVTLLPQHTRKFLELSHSSAALVAEDDAGMISSKDLFLEFVNIAKTNLSDLHIWRRVDEFERALSRQVEFMQNLMQSVPRHHSNYLRTSQVLSQLVAERNTWRLLGSLYSERLLSDSEDDQIVELGFSDKEVAGQLYKNHRGLREAQIVIDWLEKNAADNILGKQQADRVEYFGDNRVAWSNTVKTIKSQQEYNQARVCNSPFVTSADPDAPFRQSRVLHSLDQDDYMRMVHQAFVHIRAGEMQEAQELCARCGHHWMAATLEGWKLHYDPNIGGKDQRMPIQGNSYRDLWRQVAWTTASDEQVSAAERAIYGSLCGHMEAMLTMSRGWEDVLWAVMRAMVDQWVDRELALSASHRRHQQPTLVNSSMQRSTLPEVFEVVERRMDEKIKSANPHYVLQKFIILGDTKALLIEAHQWLGGTHSPHLLRCLTHLLFFLKAIDMLPVEQEQLWRDILDACILNCIERKLKEEVAWYVSMVENERSRIVWFARFLENIEDEDERRHALAAAHCVGLDVHSITALVVKSIRLRGDNTSDIDSLADLTNEDEVKISALDWLLYDNQQRLTALTEANALMRYFLISRKMAAARKLLQKIPTDSVDVIIRHEATPGTDETSARVQNFLREYFCYKAFLEANESFNAWYEHLHQKRPQESQQGVTRDGDASIQSLLGQADTREMSRWTQALNSLAKTTTERLYNVLLFPSGWMEDSEDADEEDLMSEGNQDDLFPVAEPNRDHQMVVLRSIYIPQVAILLHNVLHTSRKFKECLQLAEIIASDQYLLYKVFSSRELQRFLFKLHESSRELLDTNCDALGFSLI